MAGRRSTVLAGYFATAVVLISLRSQPMASPGAAAAGQAAATIAGSVVDASLTPLSGVTITAALGGKVVARATTDTQGKYKLSGLQPGEYVVRAERTGFPAFSRTVRIPGGTPAVQLPIVLARAEDKLERSSTMNETVVGQQASATAVPPPPPVSQPARAGAAGVAGGVAAGGRGGAADMQYRQQAVMADPFPVDSYVRRGELYASVEPNRFRSTARTSALDVRRGRGHRVVHERPPIPVAGPAAAARRRARRRVRQLLPLRLSRRRATAGRSR